MSTQAMLILNNFKIENQMGSFHMAMPCNHFMYELRFYVTIALLFYTMILHCIPFFIMYVFYEVCFVRNEEINMLLLF